VAGLRAFTTRASTVTVAYAAAYLEHFRAITPNLRQMRDVEVDRFIVQFLTKRIMKPDTGTEDDLRIKPYKYSGPDEDLRRGSGEVGTFAQEWRYHQGAFASLGPRTETTRTPIVTLPDLQQLEAMSSVCAGNISQYAANIREAASMGLDSISSVGLGSWCDWSDGGLISRMDLDRIISVLGFRSYGNNGVETQGKS
jgi:hypothetical protein